MTPLQTAKHNARLSIAIEFLTNLSFTLPIWLLYSLNYLKFTPTLAVALYMSIWITSSLLEIPTGALADRLGRKRIFIIGSLLNAVYPIAYILHPPLPAFVLLCLVGGFGYALTSGALIPVVHEAYKKAGLSEKQYHNFLSSNQATLFVARAVSGIAGALLYTHNVTWPFLALAIVTLLSAGLGLFFRDVSITSLSKTNRIHVGRTLSAISGNGIIMAVLIAFAVCNLSADSIWTGYQVFFKSDGQNTVVIGALFSIIAICSSLGAIAVRRAHGRLRASQVILIYSMGVFITSLLLVQSNQALRLAAIFPMGLVSGTTMVTLKYMMQSNIVNELQSTALSVVTFIAFITYVVGSFIFGISSQYLGLDPTRLLLMVLALLGVLVAYVTDNRAKIVT